MGEETSAEDKNRKKRKGLLKLPGDHYTHLLLELTAPPRVAIWAGSMLSFVINGVSFCFDKRSVMLRN
jgi:hypothetical protein